MSIDSISPDQAGADPRSSYLAALSVAEQIVAAAPVVPKAVAVSRYGRWEIDAFGLDLHLASPTDVVAFARWIGAHVTTKETGLQYPFETRAAGTWHGVPFGVWALHSDAEWVQRQEALAGQLTTQAHEMYDLDTDSSAVVPGCAPYACLAVRDAEVSA